MTDLKDIVKYAWSYLRPHKGIIFAFAIVYFIDQMVGMANTFLLGKAILLYCFLH